MSEVIEKRTAYHDAYDAFREMNVMINDMVRAFRDTYADVIGPLYEASQDELGPVSEDRASLADDLFIEAEDALKGAANASTGLANLLAQEADRSAGFDSND